MKIYDLKNYTNGWFVGDFDPTIQKTNNFEVAIKKYKKGDTEKSHYHKVAIEITVIVLGKVTMNNVVYHTDDIIFISPGESTDFVCLEDTITCVVKSPSIKQDKFHD